MADRPAIAIATAAKPNKLRIIFSIRECRAISQGRYHPGLYGKEIIIGLADPMATGVTRITGIRPAGKSMAEEDRPLKKRAGSFLPVGLTSRLNGHKRDAF
jgi:hypothetical protein